MTSGVFMLSLFGHLNKQTMQIVFTVDNGRISNVSNTSKQTMLIY